MSAPINIFVVYAREDKDIKQQLLLHLNPLKYDFNAIIWHDEHIDAGQEWKPHIESKLAQTDLFLLLVSVHFMNSEFINQVEFKFAIDRHREGKSIVVPVIIKHCQWKTGIHFPQYTVSLNDFQVLPPGAKPIDDWKTPDQAYSEIAAGIANVLAAIKKKRADELLHAENLKAQQEKRNQKIKPPTLITKTINEGNHQQETYPWLIPENDIKADNMRKRKMLVYVSVGLVAIIISSFIIFDKLTSHNLSGENGGIDTSNKKIVVDTAKPPPPKVNISKFTPKKKLKDELVNPVLTTEQTKLDDEDVSWNLARNENTITAFENYNNKYPNSKYVNQSLNNIAALNNVGSSPDIYDKNFMTAFEKVLLDVPNNYSNLRGAVDLQMGKPNYGSTLNVNSPQVIRTSVIFRVGKWQFVFAISGPAGSEAAIFKKYNYSIIKTLALPSINSHFTASQYNMDKGDESLQSQKYTNQNCEIDFERGISGNSVADYIVVTSLAGASKK
jgi:hypothetical protein